MGFVVLSFQGIVIGAGHFTTAAQNSRPNSTRVTRPETRESAARQIQIPLELFEKVRAYGPWDYKKQSYQYRDFTLFNFGAVTGAAGLDEQSIAHLVKSKEWNGQDAPPDEELRKTFIGNEEAFGHLLKMSERDAKVIRIARDFTWLAANSGWPREDLGFTEDRWKEYRSLFTELSLAEGIVRIQEFPELILFVARSRGLCTGGSSEGYAYSTTPISPTVEFPNSLDAALRSEATAKKERHYGFVFQHLRGNWYIFHQADW
ncbi:MAG: hypothetical protein NVS9B13_26270 [Candidatus Acidiferrum sp.]